MRLDDVEGLISQGLGWEWRVVIEGRAVGLWVNG